MQLSRQTNSQPTASLFHARPKATKPAERHAASYNDDEAATGLDRAGVVRTLKRGQELFDDGDPADCFFKVVSGAVLTYRLLPDGRRHVQDFHVAGEYVGFTIAPSYSCAAAAIADSTVISYPRRRVETLIEQQPAVGRDLLAVVSRDLSAAQDQMLLLGRKAALERLASFLLQLARRLGAPVAANQKLNLFMTRTDIADHLGLTMETVSRGLNRLKRLGAIDLPSPVCVVLRDPDMLIQMEQGSADVEI
jgi:CRP/FNR family transcriptional regulator